MKSTIATNLHRQSIRLHDYDYRLPGAYFVTLVCWQRQCLFGKIESGRMILNAVGNIVRSEWKDLPHQFRFINNDIFVIMPNHIHGIIIIEERSDVGATHPLVDEMVHHQEDGVHARPGNHGGSPLRVDDRPHGPLPGSLGAIIGRFKSRATRRIWNLPGMDRQLVWQRNYYDHIIRNQTSLDDIYRYITGNPAKWADDEYYSH